MTSSPIRIATYDATAHEAGVLAISGSVYNGHDYLPCVLSQWASDPARTIFVALAHDEPEPGLEPGLEPAARVVVGLDSVVVVPYPPSAPSIVFQALRVAPKFQGRGIASQLTAACLDHVADLVAADGSPAVASRRITTLAANASSIALHLKRGYKIVKERAFLVLPGSSSDWDFPSLPTPSASHPITVAPIAAAELADALFPSSSSSSSSTTSPDPDLLADAHIMVSDWVPLELCAEVLSALESESEAVASSLGAHAFIAAIEPDTGALVGFAHSTDSQRANGFELYSGIYATDPAVTVALYAHIVASIAQRAHDHDAAPYNYIATFFPDAHRAAIRTAFRPALLNINTSSSSGTAPDAAAAAASPDPNRIVYVDRKFDAACGMVVLEAPITA